MATVTGTLSVTVGASTADGTYSIDIGTPPPPSDDKAFIVGPCPLGKDLDTHAEPLRVYPDGSRIADRCDCGNLHTYQRGEPPEGDVGEDFDVLVDGQSDFSLPSMAGVKSNNPLGRLRWASYLFKPVSGKADPIVVTEHGYGDDDPSIDGIPRDVQLAYFARAALEMFRIGTRRAYFFQLDDNSDGRYGVFSTTASGFTPRESATSIRRILALLRDGAPTARTFTLTPLTMDVEWPAGKRSRQMLFQKADGSYWLCLWRPDSIWSRGKRTRITVDKVSVTVRFSTPRRVWSFVDLPTDDPGSGVSLGAPLTSFTASVGSKVSVFKITSGDGRAGLVPQRARAFTDSLAVVVHPGSPDYQAKSSQIVPWMNQLGATKARVGWGWQGQLSTDGGQARTIMDAMAAAGKKFIAVMPSNTDPYNAATLQEVISSRLAELDLWASNLLVLEGPNEPNGKDRTTAQFAPTMKTVQPWFFSECRRLFPTVKVGTCALIGYLAKRDCAALATDSDGRPFIDSADYVSFHSYYGDNRPVIRPNYYDLPEPAESSTTEARLWFTVNDLARRGSNPPLSSGKPIITTETGYHNYLAGGDTDTGAGVTEAQAATLMPLVWASQFAAGIPIVTLYELLDESDKPPGDEQHYGLVRADGTVKPAFTAIARVSELVSDPAPNAGTFTPTPVDITVAGTKYLLLQRANGSIIVLLWHDTAGSTVPASVTTGAEWSSRSWVDLAATPTTTTARKSWSIPVRDGLTVLELTPA